jgi:ABC-2 type transport system ATP-binding protein
MDEADRCSRLALLTAGKLIACDTPAILKSRIGGDIISMTTTDPVTLKSLLKRKLNLDVEEMDNTLRIERSDGHQFLPQLIESAPNLIDSISVSKPTLEDVFIHLTGKRLRDESQETVQTR